MAGAGSAAEGARGGRSRERSAASRADTWEADVSPGAAATQQAAYRAGEEEATWVHNELRREISRGRVSTER